MGIGGRGKCPLDYALLNSKLQCMSFKVIAHANPYSNNHHPACCHLVLTFGPAHHHVQSMHVIHSTACNHTRDTAFLLHQMRCPHQHSTERACNIICMLTSIGTQAHAAAGLSPIAHCQDEQLPLHMQHLPIRDQLVPFVTGGSLPTGWGGLFFLTGLLLRRRSLLRAADL